MLAKDVMKTEVVTVSESTPVKEVAKLMLEHDISGLPVVDKQGRVLGVVSELDLMRKQIAPNEPRIWATLWGMDENSVEKYVDALKKYMGKTAGEVMTSPALTVDVFDLQVIGTGLGDHDPARIIQQNGTVGKAVERVLCIIGVRAPIIAL